MSRVAKNPVSIPAGVEIKLEEKTITVSGSKGKSDFTFPNSVSAAYKDDFITVLYDETSTQSTALAGTTRSLIHNMINILITIKILFSNYTIELKLMERN